jgi:hypothetical protein
MVKYNWSLELQMCVDLLNTPVSQTPPTPDEFSDASPLYRRSSALPTPRPLALFQPLPTQPLYPPPYQYPPYSYPPPPIGGSSGGNAPPPYTYPPPSVGGSSNENAPPLCIHTIHLHHIATHHIHTLLPQSVVRRVVLLLNHIHTLHLNLFGPEVVTTRVAERIPLIQHKLLQG